ncbi:MULTISPECIES: heme-binding protein [unclassified Brenneria]|uniref:GlcG/HbpS family heme-binding protein n=1 Tax=unclassified Brenneria TaxID=2634434 RepID=UPI0029C14621|nr:MULTISPECIES: heme-binding protein [unclassified Brenneria]MDX5630835.1 heme-binding protein [Brenneria sp. L3-3Z]MDX5697917.1 heme-binding protein [Brenneria sp. L4-2C]
MRHDLHTELDRRISNAIARQLSPRRISLSLTDAASLAQYASEAADDCNVPIVFSLVDACGQQRYFFSMDNALLISYTLAGQKAWTAIALKMATHELAAEVQPGASLYGLQHEPGICCFGGGLPCWSDGVLLGAIGISGGTVEEDIAIANAALARFSRERFPLTSHT